MGRLKRMPRARRWFAVRLVDCPWVTDYISSVRLRWGEGLEHVDGLGRLVEKRPLGEAVDLAFSYDGHLAALLAEKGSVAVDGVSLTINAVDAKVFHVAVIPHTQEKTLLEKMSVGMEVNLEADVLARYVARWLEVGRSAAGSGGTTDDSLLSRLASSGFL